MQSELCYEFQSLYVCVTKCYVLLNRRWSSYVVLEQVPQSIKASVLLHYLLSYFVDLLSVLEVVKSQISLSISVVNQLARYTTHALDNVVWNPIGYRRNRMKTICSHKLLCCNLPGLHS